MRTLRVAKLGHAGTLDPFAEGLMVVGIGRKFTRRLHEVLISGTKEYVTTLELGKISDTFDCVGTITETEPLLHPSIDTIRTTIETYLLGEHLQIPPVYSAKKFGGKRLRDIAHREGSHELAASRSKLVTLYDFTIVSYAYPLLVVRLTVSSGYYIRTFGNSLGSLLGTGAYLTRLKRTRINTYDVADALEPDDLAGTLEAQGVFTGLIQGVGFRFFIEDLAHRFSITGSTCNTPDGSVLFTAQGSLRNISLFLKFVQGGPLHARVDDYSFVIKKPNTVFSVFIAH